MDKFHQGNEKIVRVSAEEIKQRRRERGPYNLFRNQILQDMQELGWDLQEKSTPPSSFQFNWIKAPLLKIAVDAYYELYILKTFKPTQGHKAQIKAWLNKRYGKKLSGNMKELIATLINPNKKGGAPPSTQ